jgi:di- and tripeptidase
MAGRRKQPEAASSAILSHSLSHDKSILALAVSSTHIIAGTEGGELLVRPPSAVACRLT